jgi:uncharacterized protein YjiS (DUF1127 family)
MSAHTADSQFSFQLPSLSYIDAKWEEPDLRVSDAAQRPIRSTGMAAWLSRRVAAITTRYRSSKAAAELAAMTDYELADVGLTRSDLSRVFQPGFNQDLRQRGAGC